MLCLGRAAVCYLGCCFVAVFAGRMMEKDRTHTMPPPPPPNGHRSSDGCTCMLWRLSTSLYLLFLLCRCSSQWPGKAPRCIYFMFLYTAAWFFSIGLRLGWSLANNNSPARKDQERGPGLSNLTVLISLKCQKNKYTLSSLCNREEILPPASSGKT